MKRVLIAFLFLGTVATGIWSFVYYEHRTALAACRDALQEGDVGRADEVLGEYTSSWAFRLMAEIPHFERRVRDIHGIIAVHRGDELASSAAFASVVLGGDDALSARALYNRGNLMVAKAQLEAAKEAYIRSLRIDPDDLQAKINLELLIRKIAQEQAGRTGDDLLEMRQSLLTDYWLRRDLPPGNAGKQSQRIWR